MTLSKKKKILLADPSKDRLDLILKQQKKKDFHIKIATKGSDALEILKKFQPDLVIVELVLPEVHGIEILQIIKKSSKHKNTGVILTSYYAMIQSYNSAIHLDVNYFLEKPCTASKLFELIDLFFKKELHPISFHKTRHKSVPQFVSLPVKEKKPSYLKFWGTRGSNPVSGSEYVRFGGNTPCLEIRHGKDLVIIDAGTGIRDLGQELIRDPHTKFHILFSHTHLDHLAGFPFFFPLHQPHNEVNIWAPVGFETSTKKIFADLFTYAYFPVAFEDIRSTVLFHDLRDSQELHFGKIRITTHYAFHPGSTLCFKIEINDKKIGYVTDNELLLGTRLTLSSWKKDKPLPPPRMILL